MKKEEVIAMRERHVAHRTEIEKAKRAVTKAIAIGSMLPEEKKTREPEPSGRRLGLSPATKSAGFCKHPVWLKIGTKFKQCKVCRLFMARSLDVPPTPEQLAKLPAILRGRQLPPSDPQGRYYNDIIINKRVKLRRSLGREGEYQLLIRFPKGWAMSQHFMDVQWQRIIDAIEPVLASRDPLQIFEQAQTAIYGRAWLDTVQHLL